MPNLAKDQSFESLRSRLERAIWRRFDGESQVEGDHPADTYLVHTFEDTVVFQDTNNDKLFEASFSVGDDGNVELGDPEEVQEVYVRKCLESVGITDFSFKDIKPSIELTGPIVAKNAEKRIAYAAVLVPGEEDSDGEILEAEKIEEVAHGWMENYRNVDYMHTLNNAGVPVESHILRQAEKVTAYGEEVELPAGTWVLASKAQDEQVWKDIEEGRLTGYSVMGIRRTVFKQITASKSKEDINSAMKRTLLADLGEDWVAPYVSYVDEPAVPKAKFFALKRKDVLTPPTGGSNVKPGPVQSFIEGLKSFLRGYAEEEENTDPAVKNNERCDDMDRDQVVEVVKEVMTDTLQEAVKSAVADAIKVEEIASVKNTEGEPSGEEAEPATKGEETEKTDDPINAFKSEFEERLQKLEKAAPTAMSKGLSAEEDVNSAAPTDPERDGFGRKRRNK